MLETQMTTGNATTYVIRDGRLVSMQSNDPWYRLFRVLADLFLAGEIDEDAFRDQVSRWARPSSEIACPAAQHVMRALILAIDEPSCPCDPYRETPCNCEPMDRRVRLRELLGD